MRSTAMIPARRATRSATLFIALAIASAYALPSAQSAAKKKLTIDDYTKWRSIGGQEISGDGKWVAYVLQQSNTAPAESKPVMHLLNLDTNADVEVPNATGPAFSADSQWLAYLVEPPGGRGGRGGRGGASGAPAPDAPPAPETPVGDQPQTGRGANPPPPQPRRAELRNLATGEVKSWQDIQSFTFSPASTHLVIRRRAPQAAGAAGRGTTGTGTPGTPTPGTPGTGGTPGTSGATPEGPRGVDVVLLDLRSGRHQLLGSVGDIAFNKKGDLLAFTVDGAVKDGNGLFVFDARTGRITPLDNDARVYNRLAWNDEGAAVAALKGLDVEKMREKNNVLIAFTDIRAALAGETTDGAAAAPAVPVVLDPAKADGFPKGSVISDRAALAWSKDSKRIFFGIKEQAPRPDAGARRNADETPDVDVWNTSDERTVSLQMIRAEQDRNFTYREALDLAASKFVKLADETMRDLDVAQDGRWAVGRDARGYLSLNEVKRPAADFYRVNTTTGERTVIQKGLQTGGGLGISPDGKQFLFWKDNKFQAYDLDTAATRTLGGAAAPAFVDTEYDHPGTRPSYGIAGYTSDGKSVIVHHKYDLWLMPLDGSAGKNLTNGVGTKNEIRFRYVRTESDPADAPGVAPARPGGGRGGGPRQPIDLSKPITLSAYGEWTKKAGFYELSNGELKELVYDDAAFSNPVKAAKAEKYLFTRQTFVDFPDLYVSGPGFKDAKKISSANPQQSEYIWGKRILFEFKNKDGVRLQGILGLPDDYKPGEKRPMLVTFYEKNSQNLHRYSPPSYLTGMGASPIEALSRGYITMLPDVHFHTGLSHSDMLECVEAATKKVIEMGYADPKRIGVAGHSYGGEGAAFIGVMSKMFAAVGVGAGVTDLFNDFNQPWGWSYQVQQGSGATAYDYYLYGQGRWGFSPWEDLERYRYESALVHAPKAVAPFLIMHGTADPTVGFENGLAFYHALRFNGKKAVLLAYPNEGHGLRGLANRKDLTVRYFQFFDHYLKDAPAPKWMTEGVPYLKKDENKDPK
jgi:prolyl oligopeptidase family protein